MMRELVLGEEGEDQQSTTPGVLLWFVHKRMITATQHMCTHHTHTLHLHTACAHIRRHSSVTTGNRGKEERDNFRQELREEWGEPDLGRRWEDQGEEREQAQKF